ncbi:ATP-binding protein [Bacillus solitudinis]|uniref:ATP-binding protein n=1 Tax=Bacillus solitudinis TaxID=2014074 RepID=UPI0018E27EED|nr:ATP-binding protein [Bacillus solitudinis]
MRRLLDKVLKLPSQENLFDIPSLPSDLTFSEFNQRTTRGFLARKLSQYLDLTDEEGNRLCYQSLRESSFLQSDNDSEFLLQLSEKMMKWHEQQQDVQKEIEELEIKNHLKNALLKAHDMHKQDLFRSSSPQSNHKQVESFKDKDITEWEIYRDVIFAATQGQFLLISEEEISNFATGNVFCEGTIKERTDIPLCRNKAKESLEQLGFSKSKFVGWLLVLSEAITNTIKHAEEGQMTLINDEEKNEVRFLIKDKGPGFPLEELPKKTLLAGYSTKKSMGQGFTLMMKMAKQVLLCTSSTGSTIILVFEADKEKGDLSAGG